MGYRSSVESLDRSFGEKRIADEGYGKLLCEVTILKRKFAVYLDEGFYIFYTQGEKVLCHNWSECLIKIYSIIQANVKKWDR